LDIFRATKATGHRLGLLMTFNTGVLKDGLKRFVRSNETQGIFHLCVTASLRFILLAFCGTHRRPSRGRMARHSKKAAVPKPGVYLPDATEGISRIRRPAPPKSTIGMARPRNGIAVGAQ
jgi:hypothetical protein